MPSTSLESTKNLFKSYVAWMLLHINVKLLIFYMRFIDYYFIDVHALRFNAWIWILICNGFQHEFKNATMHTVIMALLVAFLVWLLKLFAHFYCRQKKTEVNMVHPHNPDDDIFIYNILWMIVKMTAIYRTIIFGKKIPNNSRLANILYMHIF